MEGKGVLGTSRTGIRRETELPDGEDGGQGATLQPETTTGKRCGRKARVSSMEQHSAETDWFHLAHNKKGNKKCSCVLYLA